MANPQPSKVIFTTREKYFLNDAVVTDTSLTIPSQSYTSTQARSFAVSISVPSNRAFSQLVLNYSSDSATNYHVFPHFDVTISSNCSIHAQATYSGTTLNFTFFVYNNTAGTVTFPATIVTIRMFRFVSPI